MAKVLIGNFKGPKGDTGAQGEQGDKGDTGARGSRWTEGTAITGSSTTPTVFSGTGITDALAEDLYLNTDTGNVYRCTTAGAANVAKWVYACNIKGIKGDTGSKGDKGDKGEQGEKGDTGAQGPKGDTPTVADDMTVAFTEADSRTNIASGENTATLFGKIKKWLADLAAAAFMQTITSYSDLMAGTAIADYLVNAKAVQDGFNTVNGKLIRSYIPNIGGTGVLEIAGNICILQYTNGTFVPGNYVPEAYKPKFSNGVWTAVASSDYESDYRMAVLSDGLIALQKNGANVTEDTNVRGQIMWII